MNFNKIVSAIFMIIIVGIIGWFSFFSSSKVEVKNSAKNVDSDVVEFMIKPYIQQIKFLKQRLKIVTEQEDILRVSTQIKYLNTKLEDRKNSLKELDIVISNSKYKIIKKTKKILNSKGLGNAITFLETLKVDMNIDRDESEMIEIAQRYYMEALLYRFQYRFRKAKKAYEKSLYFNENVKVLASFGDFLMQQGYYTNARDSYEKVLDFGVDDKLELKINNNLAILYYKTEQLKKSLEAYDTVLRVYEKLSMNDPKKYNFIIAKKLNSVGRVFLKLGNFKQSLSIYNQALLLKKDLTIKDPIAKYKASIATTLNDMGILYSSKAEYKKAKNSFDEALRIRRNLIELNPSIYMPLVSVTLNNLGILYQNMQENQKALEAYQEALDIRRKIAKIDPNYDMKLIAKVLNDMGLFYVKQDKFEKALSMYDEVLAIYKKIDIADEYVHNIKVASILNNLGLMYANIKKYSEALKSFNEAMSIYKDLAKTNKRYDDSITNILNSLKFLYSKTSDSKGLIKVSKKMIEVYNDLAKTSPYIYRPLIAKSHLTLGELYEKQNREDESIEAYTKAFRLYEELIEIDKEAYELSLIKVQITLAKLTSDIELLEDAKEILNSYKKDKKIETLLKKIDTIKEIITVQNNENNETQE